MRKTQPEMWLDRCPECGGKKVYPGHDHDDDYQWKYDNWTCECGAKGFDAYRIAYIDTCWEMD